MTLSPEDFVVHETDLLDAGRFDDWLALFAADGRYWVPLQGEAQLDAQSHNAIALEDRLLLELRVVRLRNPRAHSQHPASRCQHVLQAPRRIGQPSGGDVVRVKTSFIYTEIRGAHQTTLTGHCVHTLGPGGALGWLIREKRVNLLEAAQALPAIQLFI